MNDCCLNIPYLERNGESERVRERKESERERGKR